MKLAILAMLLVLVSCVESLAGVEPPLTIVRVIQDNTVVDRSCVLMVPEGLVIEDADGNGVIQVRTAGVEVEFAAGSVLRGAAEGTPGDGLRGVGIRIEGAADVTIRGARVTGFHDGMWATRADRLTVDGADLSGNFRQRLRSTPEAEDGADWLYPHHNDDNEWLVKYGAALYIEDSEGVTVRNVRVRVGQNGIILDRADHAKVYDNDCSFISGWGLAMWRSSGCTVTRNAFDFCVRGHSEGVYNRGQDSAGILMFEQCSNNVVAENSVTHGGDCVFGFAGNASIEGGSREIDAAVETLAATLPGTFSERKGCGDNLFLRNDLSYAPAHGLEMTFSVGNTIFGNRMVENGICGIWGGYSRKMLVAENEFERNGGMAYGLERGAVNIEHGSDNRILRNSFRNDRCAVHLWWDDDKDLLEKPGVKRGYKGVTGNIIAANTIVLDDALSAGGRVAKMTGVQLRDGGFGHVRDNFYSANKVTLGAPAAVELDVGLGIEPPRDFTITEIEERVGYVRPEVSVLGTTTPVGAREKLRGRGQIIMSEWGPWDHERPMVRLRSRSGGEHVYEVFGAASDFTSEPQQGEYGNADGRWAVPRVNLKVGNGGMLENPVTITFGPKHAAEGVDGVAAAVGGVRPYRQTVSTRGWKQELVGTIVTARWDVRAFGWDDATDPRKDIAAWRGLAAKPEAVRAEVDAIAFKYGHGGPRDQAWGKALGERAPGGDRFGLIATTRLGLPKGKWRFSTLSDDGVRVLVNGKSIIERWDWHAPTADAAEFSQDTDGKVEIVVEHFEIDGYAVLTLDIEPVE